MAKILFDIKYRPQIESGEYKVETRSGLPARIVCWDRNAKDMEIIALVYDEHIDENNEDIAEVALNGRMFPRGKNHDYDLFIVTPEEEPSDWEKAVGLALTDYQLLPRDKDGIANIHDIEEFTKKKATELLSLAREQFVKDGYIIEKKAFHDVVEKIDSEVMKEASENIDLENFIHNLSERYPEVSFAKLTRIAKAAYDYGKAKVLKEEKPLIQVGEDCAHFAGQEKLREKLLEWIDKMHEANKCFSEAELVIPLDKLKEKINSLWTKSNALGIGKATVLKVCPEQSVM